MEGIHTNSDLEWHSIKTKTYLWAKILRTRICSSFAIVSIFHNVRDRERAWTITKKQDVTDEDPAQGERERDDDGQKKTGEDGGG